MVLGIFTALVAYAAIGGRQAVRAERQAIEAAARHETEARERLRAEVDAIHRGAPARAAADPRSPLQVGRDLLPRVAALDPAPLAGIAVGQRDVLPQIYQVTTRALLAEAGQADAANPTRRASGPFDLAFVLVFLLPLVVLAASYDVLSSEREGGTLALVLSQPVSLTTFVMGKVAQRAMFLVAGTCMLTVAGTVAAGARLSEAGGPAGLAMLLGLQSGYVLFWLACAVAVNAWGRSSAANALSLVAVWLAFTVVVPGLAAVTTDALHPTPSRAELVNLTRSAAREAGARLSALEGNHGLAPAAVDKRAIEAQEEIERRVEPVARRFDEQLGRQQSLVDSLRFVSPALLLHEGLTDVAGSGVRRHQQFSRNVARFQRELRAFFFSRTEADARLSVRDYETMPRFTHEDPPLGEAVSRVLVSLTALGGMCALLIAVAVVGLRRNFSRGFR